MSHSNNPELYIGLMSGTSVDGIDAALVEVSSANSLKVITTQFTPFDDTLRNQINELAQTNWNQHGDKLRKCSDTALHTQLADYYANASLSLLDKANVQTSQIKAIANHGQTVRHEPNASPAFSLQLGDGQLIANKTGIRTITQFRQADLAAGGQGAPLMPAFHQAIFQQQKNKSKKSTLVLNIGGISNISLLGDSVIGFDTGPGNTLLDQWVLKHKNHPYDKSGEWAASGINNEKLLNCLLKDPYFSLSQPKSTGPDYFNLNWLERICLAEGTPLQSYRPQDIQATLLELTSHSIANSIKNITHSASVTQIFICGGGAHNSFMLERLKNALPQSEIHTTDKIGVPGDWVEAAGFAWLGYCFDHNITSNLPAVTGAKEKVVLGESFSPQQ